jgi:undecaprenyl-diphosphatase
MPPAETDLFRAIALGLLQGATEFLPVSSSAHLVIVPALLGWGTPSVTFDAAVHWGTGLAVLVYFRDEWRRLFAGALRGLALGAPWRDPDGRLLVLLALATVPAVVIGLAFEETFEAMLGSPRSTALELLLTGVLLVLAERIPPRDRPIEAVSSGQALGIGLAQAVAIVPGISRSGATIAAGLAAGLDREAAARFSFLLSVPIILGGGAYEAVKFARDASSGTSPVLLATGFLAALVAGYISIGWLLDYLRRAPLYLFAAYTWVFGLAAWWWLGR